MTYEQQRNKITEEYERQRKALYNEDGTLRQGLRRVMLMNSTATSKRR